MNIYSKEELNLIKDKAPKSIYSRLKRINSFIDKDYSKYLEAQHLIQNGGLHWEYSTTLEDIQFFCKTQEYILDLIK